MDTMSLETIEELFKEPEIPIKQRLIEAGICEIEAHGVTDFSLRRTAAICGVSCAAPYKHFKSKDELILAILDRYRGEWNDISRNIGARFPYDLRNQLTEMSIEYIRFLVSNKAYMTIVMSLNKLSDDKNAFSAMQIELSDIAIERVARYCQEQKMPDEIKKAKLFVVRSLIYGAALMISNGELKNEEETYLMVRRAISREFDIKL
ncbi:MAG: TetR/AcrR family transcriptional regulator [Clostridia bacterium]|nr:TetR/AcrR family transcriptional regulator [Clostridia bacterium]